MSFNGLASAAALAISGSALASTGGIERLSSFDPWQGGSIAGLAYDTAADRLFVHFNTTAPIHVFSPDGDLLNTISNPSPGQFRGDLEIAPVAMNIGGGGIDAGSLLVFDAITREIVASSPVNGAVLARQSVADGYAGWWEGGAVSVARGTVFLLANDARDVAEVDASTGAVLSAFSVRPPGSAGWGSGPSALDILDEDGNLYLVGASQRAVRVLSPTGQWLGDFDLQQLGVALLAAIAFDDEANEAWVTSAGALVRLSGFPPGGCSPADVAPPLNVLDLSDLDAFVSGFLSQDAIADTAAPFGTWDLRDIVAFVEGFLAGCP